MNVDGSRNTSTVPEPPDAFASRYPAFGTDLGRYRNLQCLGEGGMARVYRAHDPELGLELAVKVLPRGLQITEEKRERFRREVQLLAGLTIPGVIRVFDCGEADGWQYFTMELIDGPTLTDLAHSQSLPLDQRLQMIQRLAEILAALHAADVVHRDLKPSNVMVRANGELVLTDFGIAKSFTPDPRLDLTAEDTRQGTPFYMSPDKPSALKDLAVAKQADVYSLGVLAYELLCGQLPYDIENLSPHECLTVIREEPPQPLPVDLTATYPEMSRLLMQALAKDPATRPTSAELAALTPVPAPATRHWRRVFALVLILLGLLLILAGIVSRQ